MAAAGNPHIRLYEVNSTSPQPVISYDSHTSNVMAVGFQCDGNWMYSGSEDGTVKIWDLRLLWIVQLYCLVSIFILFYFRAPGLQREYKSRAAVNTVVLHPNQVHLLHVDLQRELISGDQNGNIRVWDLTANSCSCELTMTNFEPLHKLQAHNGYILKCLLSPEFCGPHRYLATASSDHTVKIWNVDGFTLEKTLVAHQRWVWDCVFSVDGAYLITASSDTTARLWKMDSGEAIRVYQGHHKSIVCCALHDGAESSQS
ncbi:hypothetical protein MKX01_027822 [Papaver californicum]|nr:hypothetical protein MKX01_027822 [Papaver californicum]